MIWLVRMFVAVAMIAAGWKVFHQLAALQIYRATPGIEGVKEAVRWDAEGADYYFQLGMWYRDRIEEGDLALARTNLEQAVRLNPFNWRCWLELARCYEFMSLPGEAERAYLKAVELNPKSAAYRWRLGNFYLREGDLRKSFPHLKTALELEPSYRPQALALLWKAGADEKTIEELWPKDGESRLMLLEFLITNEASRAVTDALWQERLESSQPLLVTQGAFYIRHLVEAGRYDESREQWRRLTARNGIAAASYSAKKNYLWNGEFDAPISGAILDWQPTSSEAFSIRQSEEQGVEKSAGLRIDFHGTENADFRGLQQQAVVDPGRDYEFSFAARSQEISTEEGLFFQVADSRNGALFLETEPILGTTSWTRYAGSVRVPSDTYLLTLTLKRKPSRRIDNLLRGTLWLDLIALRRKEVK